MKFLRNDVVVIFRQCTLGSSKERRMGVFDLICLVEN